MCQGDEQTDLTQELEAAELYQGSLTFEPLQNLQSRHHGKQGLKMKLGTAGGLGLHLSRSL